MSTFDFEHLQGEWKAQFDMPIQYTFHSETKLELKIQTLDPVTLNYSFDVGQNPWTLDINHSGGPLGTGTEPCIFKFESDGQELHIASPLPQGSNSFGPRPTDFGGVTTVVFTRPGSEEAIRARAMKEVEGLSNKDKLLGYFGDALKLLSDAKEKMVRVMSTKGQGNPMEMIMMQQMQMATKMRKVEMRYHAVMSQVEAKFKSPNPYDWDDPEVASAAKKFLSTVQDMESFSQTQAMMLMQQQQAAAAAASGAGGAGAGMQENSFIPQEYAAPSAPPPVVPAVPAANQVAAPTPKAPKDAAASQAPAADTSKSKTEGSQKRKKQKSKKQSTKATSQKKKKKDGKARKRKKAAGDAVTEQQSESGSGWMLFGIGVVVVGLGALLWMKNQQQKKASSSSSQF